MLADDVGKGQSRRASRSRGLSDHGLIDSIYFRDPNGYVIELCAKRAGHDALDGPGDQWRARALQRWTAAKAKG